ncbi:hypothetical protein [Calothrix sp. PCC 7507]|uniref:hypothetical protein n=1 Tax=Calothrix sp. PCC 7507 TaxID=99598 RepID=UPI001181819E|nr:hypothetical protein [Calothrix sp. PCC 7507]
MSVHYKATEIFSKTIYDSYVRVLQVKKCPVVIAIAIAMTGFGSFILWNTLMQNGSDRLPLIMDIELSTHATQVFLINIYLHCKI